MKKKGLPSHSFEVREDQVWNHIDHPGVEYITMLIANRSSIRSEYPTIVNYYGPDGKVWAKEMDEFLAKMNFVRNVAVPMTPEEKMLAPWIAAGLADEDSCDEFKAAASAWLNDLPTPREEA